MCQNLTLIGFLESILEKNKVHLQDEADDECSIPDLSIPSLKYQSLPGLAQINIEEEETFEPIDPMDEHFFDFKQQSKTILDHTNFGSLSSIQKSIGGTISSSASVSSSGYFGTNTTNSSHLVSTIESMSIPRPLASIKPGQR